MRPRTKVYVINMGRKFWYLQWKDPITGERKTESSKCTRKRDADRVAVAKEDQLAAAVPAGDGSLPWDTFLIEYDDHHLASLKPSSRRRALSILNVLTETMKPDRIGVVTTGLLQKYAKKLRDAGRSEATISTHFGAIHTAMEWAKDAGHIAESPKSPRIARAFRKRSKGRPLTPTEFAKMLQATSGVVGRKAARSWRRLLRGLWLSGLRIEEAMQLSWDDRSALWIETSGPFPLLGVQAEHEKGKQDRLLPITPDFGEWLMRTPPSQRTGFVFKIVKQRRNELRNAEHASKVIAAIGEASGVVVNTKGKFASAHDLRRSFGLRWSQEVMPAELQQLMRHEDISTTMTYYAVMEATAFAEKLWKRKSTPDSTPNPKQ